MKIGKRNYKREKEEKNEFIKEKQIRINSLKSIHQFILTKGHVSLISIAERNGISPQYLEHIFASLRRAGIIKSIKGAQGGYLHGDSSLHELQWHQLSKL